MTGANARALSPAYPVPPPPRSPRRAVAAGLAILVIVSAGLGLALLHPWTRCGAGVERTGERQECVGVTDGEAVFAPELAAAERAIKGENDWVRSQQRPYVSVAYVGTMTPGDMPAASVRHELEGAYIAQFAANHSGFSGSAPLVRLLLASDGIRNAQWRPVVAELNRLIDTDNLVAVVGLGLRSTATDAEVNALHEAGLPIVATALPAGDLVGKGLVSISPTDSAQIDAAVDYEGGNEVVHGRGALIVQDVNQDDVYANRLGSLFKRRWDARGRPSTVLPFHSNLPEVGPIFASMVHGAELCRDQIPVGTAITPAALPPLVFFAGRGDHLAAFTRALADGCLPPDGKPYQVITGPDAANAPDDDVYRQALNRAVTITYVGRVVSEGDAPAQTFRGYYLQQFHQHFSGDRADDEQAVVADDAVWMAVSAIRGAAQNTSSVQAGAVLAWLTQLRGTRAVSGVTGRIDLDNCGNRVNEVVPVVRPESAGKGLRRGR